MVSPVKRWGRKSQNLARIEQDKGEPVQESDPSQDH